jgi:hypothetical protein
MQASESNKRAANRSSRVAILALALMMIIQLVVGALPIVTLYDHWPSGRVVAAQMLALGLMDMAPGLVPDSLTQDWLRRMGATFVGVYDRKGRAGEFLVSAGHRSDVYEILIDSGAVDRTARIFFGEDTQMWAA